MANADVIVVANVGNENVLAKRAVYEGAPEDLATRVVSTGVESHDFVMAAHGIHGMSPVRIPTVVRCKADRARGTSIFAAGLIIFRILENMR